MEGSDNSVGSGDNPLEVFHRLWFVFVAVFVVLFFLVLAAVVIILGCRNRARRRRRSFMITDKNEHDAAGKLQEVIGLNVIVGVNDESDFEFSPEASSFTVAGKSISSSNLSENSSITHLSHVSQTSSTVQLVPLEDSSSTDRNSVVMDSSELKPLSVAPPAQRRRSRRSDYDRLEKIPESSMETGKLFVFLPPEPAPGDDDNVFENSPALPPRLPRKVADTDNVHATMDKSQPNKRGSFSTYEDASSIPYPEKACISRVSTHATEAVTTGPDHYKVPSEVPQEVTTIVDKPYPSDIRPHSSIYTSIDDVDVELPQDRRTSLPTLTTAESLALSSHLADASMDRPISSIYANIDDIPDSVLPQEVVEAGERHSSIYTTIDETLPPVPSSTDGTARHVSRDYSYTASLVLTSPEKAGKVGSQEGEFRPVPDGHHVYTYIMDSGDREVGLRKGEETMHTVVYQNIPATLLEACKYLSRSRNSKFTRSMSTPDILLSSKSYDETPTTFGSPQKYLASPQSGISTHSSNSQTDLTSLQLQEELEQYSAYYNAARIAGVGGWVVKNVKPVADEEDEQASGQNDDYHSDVSLWLTPEQKSVRSWSLGNRQGVPYLQQQPSQVFPGKQAATEGNYTKIFAREVQRHVYERPCFIPPQNRTLGRPVKCYSHKTPNPCSYVNQLVWLSSNKPVYPQFHRAQDSDSHYTRLLRATELDDDGYTMPVV